MVLVSDFALGFGQVEGSSPMKRGLKFLIFPVQGGTAAVEGSSPMKRGLK